MRSRSVEKLEHSGRPAVGPLADGPQPGQEQLGPLAPLYIKEARAYFNAPIAYIVCGVFLLLTGYFFAQPLFLTGISSIEGFTDMTPLLLVFFMPAITMRLYSEEYREGTLEILYTLPVPSHLILAAKYLASLTVLAFALAPTLIYPLTVAVLGSVDPGAILGSYLGLFLAGATLAAAGVLASTCTRNQIVAFVTSFLIGFSLFLFGKIGVWTPARLLPLTNWLGFDSHLASLSRGLLDLRDLLYFGSLTAFFLFLAHLNTSRSRA